MAKKILLALLVVFLLTLALVSCGDTEGIVYDISADGTYAEVIGYSGTATKIRIADTYEGLPVKNICNAAFYKNYKITSVIIPDSVTSIGGGAFQNCTSLTRVVIGDSVTRIGASAFSDCDNLTRVVIPNSVTRIGDWAFSDCNNLTNITVDENNQSYMSIGGNLYSKDGKILIQYAIGKSESEFIIPNSVTSIDYGAFSNCDSLTSVVIGDSVTSIGDAAFYECSSLSDVYYTGTEAEWKAITIGSGNYDLTSATIHYNYVPEE